MENMEIIKDIDGVEQVVINREDGSQLSMSKTRWDELQANQVSGTIS